jgi:hypothetical protein
MLLDDAGRAALYAGRLDVLEATPAIAALSAAVWDRVVRRFAPLDPREAHAKLGNDAHFERFAALRQGIPHDPSFVRLAFDALASLGVAPPDYRVDRPRVRAVASGAHRIAEARPAYGQHRDTWYANPRAQLNHWIPLHPLLDEERIGFFPQRFGVAVPNTSGGFDLDAWQSLGGFQAYARPQPTRQHHPAPLEPLDWALAPRPAVPFGSILRFSAHHLHGTVPHDSGRTRYTLELRAVHARDHRVGLGAPSVDDGARGDTFATYLDEATSSA